MCETAGEVRFQAKLVELHVVGLVGSLNQKKVTTARIRRHVRNINTPTRVALRVGGRFCVSYVVSYSRSCNLFLELVRTARFAKKTVCGCMRRQDVNIVQRMQNRVRLDGTERLRPIVERVQERVQDFALV